MQHHSECWADQGSNHGGSQPAIDPNGKNIFRYNVFEECEGTGFLISVGSTANLEVYGNVFMYHQGNPYRRRGVGNAIIGTSSSSTASGTWLVYNNTFVNPGDNTGQAAGSIVSVGNIAAGASGTLTAFNNLCYFTSGTTCSSGSSRQMPVTHDWTYCI